MLRTMFRPRLIVSIAALGAILWLVYANWQQIADSFDELSSISWRIISVCLLLTFLTFGLAAASYYFLAFRKLRKRELAVIELASAFINRLVPSGIGGVGMHGLYLYRQKHTPAQATTIIGANNILSFATHMAMLVLFVAIAPLAPDLHLTLPASVQIVFIGAAIVSVLLVTAVFAHRLFDRIASFAHDIVKSLRHYHGKPHKLLFAAISLALLTLTNVLILWLISSSIGISLGYTTIFIIFSAGVLVGAAIPTPGGFGGAEAGLIAGFIAYGVPTELAIAAALAFRFCVYWFPLLPGGIALVLAFKMRLLARSR